MIKFDTKTRLSTKRYSESAFVTTLLLIVFFLAVVSCRKSQQQPDELVVAKIGDRIITVQDFRKNYELGFPHLKKAPNRKRSYLDYMIKEKLLSLAGYQLGLDQSERVKKLEKELLDELLIEELFRTNVDNKIKITQKEINEAINKSKISWKLRYWMDTSPENANYISQAMRVRGYSAVVQDILESNPEIRLRARDFETQYLTWLEVSPELLDAIKDLRIGEISDPVELDGVYFIFQIVDIRRQGILENEYLDKAATYKKILFYRKAITASLKYVSDYMTPKNVITKSDAFFDLTNALLEWKKLQNKNQKTFLQAVKDADRKTPALLILKKKLRETLVTFQGGQWSIKDFLDRFDPSALRKDLDDPDQYRHEINQQIALKIRNYFFLKEAHKQGLHKLAKIRNQLNEWKDKWVYEETRKLYTKDVVITEKEAKYYFDKFKDRYKSNRTEDPEYQAFRTQAIRDAYLQKENLILSEKLDSLRRFYPVKINKAVFDTIQTIDSRKSRWMSLQAFKRNSNRPAVPIVDPAWQ